MFRVGSWLYKTAPANVSTESFDALSESQELESALRAAAFIMSDDVDSAEEGLNQGNSTFHKLGKGVVAFIRATLGFEQEVMRQASERLNETEASASIDQHKAHHNANAPNAYRSPIYAPGTEYLLCQSMAQLMGAVVGVLNESLTESIRAFYKLRRAYIALDGILQMEEAYLQARNTRMATASSQTLQPAGSGLDELKDHLIEKCDSNFPSPSSMNCPESLQSTLLEKEVMREAGDADGELPETKKGHLGALALATANHLEFQTLADEVSDPSIAGRGNASQKPSGFVFNMDGDSDSDIFNNPVDIFVHSGANLCFGLLLLLISMVPPVFSRLLYVIGFRGDRERGLRMLWKATRFHNLNGAIAGLALLGFYNGFVRFCDIMPDASVENGEDIDGYPLRRLTALLSDMRGRYPLSQLWLLEESRMHGANKRLDIALDLLCGDSRSPLKQVEALHVFEKGLDAMYLHKYLLCSDCFVECVALNSWSRALYYYIAASSHLVLYRKNAQSHPSLAQDHASKATELFRKAPTQAGKKRFMARQLPFDIFVTRKVTKWESRAKEWNVDFIDAVGVDPIEEMIYFWNGHSRMTEEELEESLKNLAWSESSENKTWHRESADEHSILALLRAAILRSLQRHDEAKELLQSQILSHDKATFKGHLKDEWTCPAAHYEMAVNLWMERSSCREVPLSTAITSTNQTPSRPSSSAELVSGMVGTVTGLSTPHGKSMDETQEARDRQKVQECGEWLEKAAKWEGYELDARIGLKITAAQEAVKKWEALHSY